MCESVNLEKTSLTFQIFQIDYFTALCSVTRRLNKSEAGVELALMQTSLPFLRKSCCCNANEFLFTS